MKRRLILLVGHVLLLLFMPSLLTHYCCTFYFLPSDNPQQLEIGKMFLKSIMSNYDEIPNSDGMKLLPDVVES